MHMETNVFAALLNTAVFTCRFSSVVCIYFQFSCVFYDIFQNKELTFFYGTEVSKATYLMLVVLKATVES